VQSLDPIALPTLASASGASGAVRVQLEGQQRAGIVPGQVKLANLSGWALQVRLGADVHWLPDWEVDVFPVPPSVSEMTVTPVVMISPGPSSTLLVSLASADERIPGVFPATLSTPPIAQQVIDTASLASSGNQVTHNNVPIPQGTLTLLAVGVSTVGQTGDGIVFMTGVTTGLEYEPNASGTSTFGSVPVSGLLYFKALPMDSAVNVTYRATGSLQNFWLLAILDPSVTAVGNQASVILTDSVNNNIFTTTEGNGSQAVGDMLGVTRSHSLPAPWEAPNLLPIMLNFALTGGAANRVLVLFGSAGHTIYMFSASMGFDAPGGTVHLSDGDPNAGGNNFAAFAASTITPPPQDYHGAPLSPGNSLYIWSEANVVVRGVAVMSRA
jgi:hypothetical protein